MKPAVLRIGFTAREGLVLHRICYTEDGNRRSVIHRASLSEMFVPYGDPAPTQYRKLVLDEGDPAPIDERARAFIAAELDASKAFAGEGWTTETLADELRAIYRSDPLRSDVLMAAFLEQRLKAHDRAGQLRCLQALVDHFGWMGSVERPLTAARAAGMAVMLVGVWLVLRD